MESVSQPTHADATRTGLDSPQFFLSPPLRPAPTGMETRRRRRLREEQATLLLAQPQPLPRDADATERREEYEDWQSCDGVVGWPVAWNEDHHVIESDIDKVVDFLNVATARNHIGTIARGSQLSASAGRDDVMAALRDVFERLLDLIGRCRARGRSLTCIDTADFLIHPCVAQYMTEGGFNQVYAHRFLDVVVRIGRKDRTTSMKRLVRQRQILEDLARGASQHMPRLYFNGFETLHNRPVQVWQRCDGTCSEAARGRRGVDPALLACGITDALVALAACRYINFDVKLSNMVYERRGDALQCFLIDVDDKFFMHRDELARKSGYDGDDLHVHMAAIMITCIAAQNARGPVGRHLCEALDEV